jgi:hypothetical protein
VQAPGDRIGRKSLGDELRPGPLALGEVVGVRDEGRELVGAGGLDDHGRLSVRAVAERRAAHEQPDPGRGSDAGAGDGARRRVAVDDAARPGRRGGDHGWEVLARATLAQLGEPHLGGCVGPHDRVVGSEQHETGGLLGLPTLRGQRAGEHGAAQALGEVARDGLDERRVGRREAVAVGAAQQRERAPRGRVVDQHGSQLVAEPVGPPELAMAHAVVEVSARRLAEARRAPRRAAERAEAVEVLPADLDLGHEGGGRLREPVLDHLARRQERGRIHRQHADAVERDRARQDPGGVEREVAHAGAAVQEPDEVAAEAFG